MKIGIFDSYLDAFWTFGIDAVIIIMYIGAVVAITAELAVSNHQFTGAGGDVCGIGIGRNHTSRFGNNLQAIQRNVVGQMSDNAHTGMTEYLYVQKFYI